MPVAAGLALAGLFVGVDHLVTIRRRRTVAASGRLTCSAALRGAEAPYPMRAQLGRLTAGRERLTFRLRSGTTLDLTPVGLQLTRVRLVDPVETGDDDLSRLLLCEDGNGTPVELALSAEDAHLLRTLLTEQVAPPHRGSVKVTAGRPRPWRSWPLVVTLLTGVPLAVIVGLLLTGTTVPARIEPAAQGCELVWVDPYQGVERRMESGCFGGATDSQVVLPARGLPDAPVHIEDLRFFGVFLGGLLLLTLGAVPWRSWSWRREDTVRAHGEPSVTATSGAAPAVQRAAPPAPWTPADLLWTAAATRAAGDRVMRCAPRVDDGLRRWRGPLRAGAILVIPAVPLMALWPAYTATATEFMPTHRAEATVTEVVTTYPGGLEEFRIGFTTGTGEQVIAHVLVHGWPHESPPATLTVEHATARPEWVRAVPPSAGHRQGSAAAAALLLLTLGGVGLALRGPLGRRRATRRIRRTGPTSPVRHTLIVTDGGQVTALFFTPHRTGEPERPPIGLLDLTPDVAAGLPPVGAGVIHGALTQAGLVVYEVADRVVPASEFLPVATGRDVMVLADHFNAETDLYQQVW